MRSCPSCGRASPDDHDWCACGEYLGFDAAPAGGDEERGERSGAGALTQALVQAPAAEAPPRPTVVLLVRRADSHVYLNPDEPPLAVGVAAGRRASVKALVRNQGVRVDGFDLRIEGADPAWWTIAPASVDLIPFGTREGYEAELEIVLHPPRSPQTTAGDWPLLLVVRSRQSGRDVASVRLVMRVEPYRALAAEVRPQLAAGRRRAMYSPTLRNGGNTPIGVVLSCADPEDGCRFDLVSSQFVLQAGAAVQLALVARPRRQIWIGRPVDRRFELLGRIQEEPDLVASAPATFRQRPWLPWWVAIVLPLLLLAILALVLLLGDRSDRPAPSTVPDLIGVPKRIMVKQKLEDAGLKLADEVQRGRVRDLRDGTRRFPVWAVIDQSPKAGEQVAPGSEVSIVIQAPPRVTVPSLKGDSAPDAEQALAHVGLKLGKVDPGPDPKLRVVSQIPKAGTKRRRGTAVDIVLADPRAAKGGKRGGGGSGEGGGKDGGGGGGGGEGQDKAGGQAKVEVPPFKDARLPAYADTLAAARLGAVSRRRISSLPRGTVLATTPKPGTKVARGAKVRVVVSAGFPQIAYDDGRSIIVASGVSGVRRPRLATGPPRLSEPTWTAAGRRVAYRAGTALFLRRVGGGAPLQITPIGSSRQYAHPAFAPTRQRDVLAFVRSGADGDALCLTAVGRRRARSPSCTPAAGWSLERISWAPDGGLLLVVATKRGAPSRSGLLLFTTDSPFSIDASSWRRSTEAPQKADVSGVRAAAISPDGRRLAAVRKRSNGTFALVLTTAEDLRLEEGKSLRVAACDVAWRPDGRELAVVQAGPACPRGAPGTIVRFPIREPSRVVTIAPAGLHPVWEPISLRGA